MIKFLLQLVTVLLVFGLRSQNVNRAEHSGVDEAGGIVSSQSRFFSIQTTKTLCCGSELILSGYDASMNQLFRNSYGYYSINNFGKIIKASDHTIVFTGHSVMACDLSGSKEFLVKVDTNGNQVFNTLVIPSGGSFVPQIRTLTEHKDGSFYMAMSGSILFHCSATGQLLPNINISASSITALLGLSNGNILLNANIGNTRKNFQINSQGTILQQQNASSVITKFIQTSSGIYALTSNGIVERYDTNLVYLGNSLGDLSSVNYTISDMSVNNDSIFVTGEHNVFGSPKHPFYAQLSPALGLVYQTVSSLEGVKPKGIAVSNQQVNVFSTSISEVSPKYSFVSYHRFAKNGTFDAKQDIGVTGMSPISSTFSPGNYYAGFLTAKVDVKNFGADTVKSFYLNYYAFVNGYISWCYVLLHQLVELPIPPGQSISFTTDKFQVQPVEDIYADTTIKAGKWKVCLFTTAPNGQSDANIHNDAFCDTVQLLVGLPEWQQDVSVNVFPNPSGDEFYIQASAVIQTLKVFGIRGELLRSAAPNSCAYTWGKDLPPGMYVMELKTEKGTLIKKVLKH